MKIRNIFVLLVCAFLFISSVSAFAETCSPSLIKQYFPQYPYENHCPIGKQPSVRVINAQISDNLVYLSVVYGLWCETGYPSRYLQIIDVLIRKTPYSWAVMAVYQSPYFLFIMFQATRRIWAVLTAAF